MKLAMETGQIITLTGQHMVADTTATVQELY